MTKIIHFFHLVTPWSSLEPSACNSGFLLKFQLPYPYYNQKVRKREKKERRGNAICTNEFSHGIYNISVSYDHNQEAWEIVFISHNYVFRLKTHYVAMKGRLEKGELLE